MKENDCFKIIADMLPDSPVTDGRENKFWTNGEEILCRDESSIRGLANLLNQAYAKKGESLCIITTGSYDPDEDAGNEESDERTGWYYVSVL